MVMINDKRPPNGRVPKSSAAMETTRPKPGATTDKPRLREFSDNALTAAHPFLHPLTSHKQP